MKKNNKKTAIKLVVEEKRTHPLHPERFIDGRLKPGRAPVRRLPKVQSSKALYNALLEVFNLMGGTKGLLRWAKGHRVVYYRDVLPRVLPNLSIQQIISEELAQEQPEGDRNLFVHVIQRYDSRFVDDLDAICLSCGFDTDELQRFAGQPVTDGENSQEMRQLTPVARTDEKDGSKIRVKQRTHSQGEKSATKILADHQPQRLKI